MQAPRNRNIRWWMLSLVFLATTINYLDRQVMGLLKPVLEKEFSWDEKDYSYIVMAFTTTYAIGYWAMGRFIDRVGTRIGYAVSLIVWSLASIGHGFVKNTIGKNFFYSSIGDDDRGYLWDFVTEGYCLFPSYDSIPDEIKRNAVELSFETKTRVRQ